jgi:hypothetical protein
MTMPSNTALDRLWTHLHALHESLVEVWKTVVDFTPDEREHYLVDAVSGAVDQMQGLCQEAIAAVGRAQSHQDDIPGTRDALTSVGQKLVAADQEVTHALRERSPQLEQLGRERGADWREWSGLVIAELGAVTTHLRNSMAALLAAWRQLVDREELAISTLRGPGGS